MIRTAGAPPFGYVGTELDLFEKAANWKRYWAEQISPFVRGDVLEVGAGIGANTKVLERHPHRSWTCLEPDASLIRKIPLDRKSLKTVTGTIEDLPPSDCFDTILYLDVLEHIEDDRTEIARAAEHLKRGGHLVILSPAHEFLYTPFDEAIGHFRRYSRASLSATVRASMDATRALVPCDGLAGYAPCDLDRAGYFPAPKAAGAIAASARLQQVRLVYLDSAGMLASLVNRVLLHQSMPTERQILTWDRLLVPLSRLLDPLSGRTVGKSVLGVWRREQ